MTFKNNKINKFDFLEGCHILIGCRDEKTINDLKESLDLVIKKRKIAIIELNSFFQPYGVGYYQGSVIKIKKNIVGMLEDIEKRPFLETLILDGIISEMNLECLCILKSLVDRGMQLVILEDNKDLDKEKNYIVDEILKIYFNDLFSRRVDTFSKKFYNK